MEYLYFTFVCIIIFLIKKNKYKTFRDMLCLIISFLKYRNAVRIKAALNMWHSKLSAWSKHISI
ncbi:hypothetical protein BpHYR1_005398 [Brachionus plicatilis]|uniref:Uncharacterized protein n=1 Tax=Brachionus plicatilis TaxID=10195 RepID=A0A3M7R0Y5_BRAPC|nr:hypothetical protein BpHYR1_005398 [Brachionus plicatilis]